MKREIHPWYYSMRLNCGFSSDFCGPDIEVDWRDGDREGK